MKHRIGVVTAALAIAAAALSAVDAAPASASNPNLQCSPAKIDRLTYKGGYIETDPSVTLVFWGSWWKTANAAPAITEMKNLFTGLAGSSWAKTVTQYCDAYGDIPYTWQPSLLKATYIDVTAPPAAPTTQQMTAEAAKYATVPMGDYGPFAAGVPMIITPPKVTPPGDGPVGSTKLAQCGEHSWGTELDNGVKVYYQWADVPYGVISATPVCEPNASAQQGMSVVAGHEWAETVTDPYIGGPGDPQEAQTAWIAKNTNQQYQEIGDLCEPDQTDLAGNHINQFWLTLKTGKFWMQQLWSNEAGSSTLQGECVKGS